MIKMVEDYEKEAKAIYENYILIAKNYRDNHKSQVEKRLYEQFLIDFAELGKLYDYNFIIK